MFLCKDAPQEMSTMERCTEKWHGPSPSLRAVERLTEGQPGLLQVEIDSQVCLEAQVHQGNVRACLSFQFAVLHVTMEDACDMRCHTRVKPWRQERHPQPQPNVIKWGLSCGNSSLCCESEPCSFDVEGPKLVVLKLLRLKPCLRKQTL